MEMSLLRNLPDKTGGSVLFLFKYKHTCLTLFVYPLGKFED